MPYQRGMKQIKPSAEIYGIDIAVCYQYQHMCSKQQGLKCRDARRHLHHIAARNICGVAARNNRLAYSVAYAAWRLELMKHAPRYLHYKRALAPAVRVYNYIYAHYKSATRRSAP